MAQFAFDDSLRTELAPRAIDFPETTFFRSQNSSNRLRLPTTADVRSRVGGQTAGTVAFPELGLFVKFGYQHRVSIEEAQALQAIHRAFPNNEVRVPELVAWRAEDNINYIYMSLIPGSTLQSCWPTLTLAERTNITDQLAQIFATLRSVRQSPGTEYIGRGARFARQTVRWLTMRCPGALDHGPVQAFYFEGQTVGPFPDSKEFNDAVQFWAMPKLPLLQRPPDPYRLLLPDTASICFTHGDLHLDNIIVSKTADRGYIVSIIDWGQAGWYPEYWEYFYIASDTYDCDFFQEGWIHRMLRPYQSETEALGNYWSWRGPV